MAKAKNQVVEGKFKGQYLIKDAQNIAQVCYGWLKTYPIIKENVEKIELLTAEQSKDIGSSVARGLVGGVLLGPVVLVAGALLGKDSNINRFEITYKNGEKSLVEVDKKIGDCILSVKWDLENPNN